ncbi:large conductance mechanosensitive channel protein MscL [Gordonia sp. ABSL1-1]|uniref:large conductance mechanosensitive channel protein MscL n=1 Tax=Gordonia sp. ABSL1-1 TaxID=3053923 RepID=UPI002572F510|nr:large conductance mechanosensitive channel protein MscL [Gordonia sp. ABSL1-1]MDL9938961.1 large conductance mechanosensitive channel protein MscL [Gordonia sp. ABSL1-1]
MLKGFKDFILKGNVVELATAVIVGAAFTAIVTAFTDGIVNPLINAIPIGTDAAKGLGFQLVGDKPSTYVDLGLVITAVINFVIIAAVVYFLIILPYNKLSELGGYGKKAEVTEVALLAEIRDLLDPEGSSKAKEEAEQNLPDDLGGPTGPGGPPPVEQYPAGSTQRIATAPPSGPVPTQAPTQGLLGEPGQPYPTPQPAPGNYPPAGNYPPPPGPGPQPGNYGPAGNFPPAGNTPGGQFPEYPQGEGFPGDYPPDAPGRHSR